VIVGEQIETDGNELDKSIEYFLIPFLIKERVLSIYIPSFVGDKLPK